MGRAVVIHINGSWLRTAEDTNQTTTASTPGAYLGNFTVKKAHVRNISGSSYPAAGLDWYNSTPYTCV